MSALQQDAAAPKPKGPSVDTLRTRLLATEALYKALRHRHARVNSGESLRELVKCRGHVLEARAALARAVAS